MTFYRLFPIRVHCWGGFGSQLFALNLIFELSRRFPHRKCKLILHSGGVTRRNPESIFLLGEIPYALVSDFVPSAQIQSSKKFNSNISNFESAKSRFRNMVIHFIRLTGTVAALNSNDEFNRVKPWVLSCRGHYTHLWVSDDFLKNLGQKSKVLGFGNPSEGEELENIVVQYRLGDLVALPSKSPIDPLRITNCVNEILSKDHNLQVTVLTDSIELAKKKISLVPEANFPNFDSWETIKYGIHSKYFIGTNSKISEWIIIWRSLVYPDKLNFIPSSFRGEVQIAIPPQRLRSELIEI
jgi:hypothetical protein